MADALCPACRLSKSKLRLPLSRMVTVVTTRCALRKAAVYKVDTHKNAVVCKLFSSIDFRLYVLDRARRSALSLRFGEERARGSLVAGERRPQMAQPFKIA